MSIDVYATAGAIEKDLRTMPAVIVDVLRASSVITTAIEHGCKSVIPVAEVEDAAMMPASWAGSGCSFAASARACSSRASTSPTLLWSTPRRLSPAGCS